MIQAQVVPNPTAGYCTMQEARTDLVLRWHCEPDPARFGSWSWRERALRAAARRLCTRDIASYRGVACWWLLPMTRQEAAAVHAALTALTERAERAEAEARYVERMRESW